MNQETEFALRIDHLRAHASVAMFLAMRVIVSHFTKNVWRMPPFGCGTGFAV